MCTMFSQLQHLSNWTSDKMKRLKEAKSHIRFVMELYTWQLKQGRLFLHEHPRSATSWHMREVQEVRNLPGVRVVHADQCMFGLTMGFQLVWF